MVMFVCVLAFLAVWMWNIHDFGHVVWYVQQTSSAVETFQVLASEPERIV